VVGSAVGVTVAAAGDLTTTVGVAHPASISTANSNEIIEIILFFTGYILISSFFAAEE
jgi:hypothetical protein